MMPGGCVRGEGQCACSCHTTPGVKHVMACCDAPPARQDEERARLMAQKDKVIPPYSGVDPEILNKLEKGTWHDIIPVKRETDVDEPVRVPVHDDSGKRD